MINKINKLWLFVMSRFVQFLLVSIMLAPSGAKAAQATCIENKAALLELDFMSFDQDFEGAGAPLPIHPVVSQKRLN